MPDLPIRDEAGELRLLFEVVRALDAKDAGENLSSALEQVLALVSRYTGMMRGTIALVAPDENEILPAVTHGLKKTAQKIRYRMGEGVTGTVIATGTPMVVPKVSEEPLFLNRTGARDLSKEEISFLCVPVLVDGKPVGALSADRLFADSVCLEEDMRLLQILASLIARAVATRREILALQQAVMEENRRLQALMRADFDACGMVAGSACMRSVLEEVMQVAKTPATVLIRGESGTGKELVAGIIHTNSPRAGRPFIKVNCAALPEGLVESELFGHERGAFTGAVALRKGRFEAAHGGTLFLDEVGDLTPATQAKLLRVVQEREFERLGGTQTRRVDVRLVAATNRNLEDMVRAGLFREDLYYRLSVFPVILPPLRERKDDIMALAGHLADASAPGKRIRFSPEAAALLRAHNWPGNIREMQNVVERAVILAETRVIRRKHLPAWLGEERKAESPLSGDLRENVESLEKHIIEEAVKEARGNMASAARQLGVTERIMQLRMKKYRLRFRDFRGKST